MAVGVKIHYPGHGAFAAHVGNHAVNPRFIEKTLEDVPVHAVAPESLVVIRRQVQKEHLIVRNLAEQSLQSICVPDIALVSEHPSLHDPYRIRVGGGNGAVDLFPEGAEHIVAGFDASFVFGKFHFIEGVRKKIGVFSEFLLPFLHVQASYFKEKGLFRRKKMGVVFLRPASPPQPVKLRFRIKAEDSPGNETGKSGTNGGHAQGFHPVQDAVLQGDLFLVPAGGQGAVMIDDVSHPLPGKMGRPRVKFFYFFFRQPQLLPDPDGDPLRGNQSQGHVDAVQSHPVYFLFPAFPGPVGHRVSIGDHIEIIVVAERRNDAARRGVRQLCRPANVLVFPGYHSQTVRFQKIIESPAKGCAAASPDRQHSSGGFRLENIISVFFFNGFQVQFFRGGGQRRHGPHDDCAGGFPFPVFLHVFREYMQACHHQKDQNSGKG